MRGEKRRTERRPKKPGVASMQFVVLASHPPLGRGSSAGSAYGRARKRLAVRARQSPEATLDLDFTAEGDFPDNSDTIRDLLNSATQRQLRGKFQVKGTLEERCKKPEEPRGDTARVLG